MSHSSAWYEDKPLRASPRDGPSGSPAPNSRPPASSQARSGGVEHARTGQAVSAAALPPSISFRCQLAGRLREAVAGRSNRFVATHTGYNEETVRRYLRDGGPSAEFLAAVCRVFGVNAEWLLLGNGSIRPTARTDGGAAMSESDQDHPAHGST